MGDPVNFKSSEPITTRRSQEPNRRQFLGGSDARVIMGSDEGALIRLWQEKRGEAEPEDLSGHLIVQLGGATEALNRNWYERSTGRSVTDAQRWVQHPVHRYLAATLDGFVNDLDAVFEAKFMLPWSFSEEAAAEKHMAQLQHNMWVTNARLAALSIITGGGKWIVGRSRGLGSQEDATQQSADRGRCRSCRNGLPRPPRDRRRRSVWARKPTALIGSRRRNRANRTAPGFWRSALPGGIGRVRGCVDDPARSPGGARAGRRGQNDSAA